MTTNKDQDDELFSKALEKELNSFYTKWRQAGCDSSTMGFTVAKFLAKVTNRAMEKDDKCLMVNIVSAFLSNPEHIWDNIVKAFNTGEDSLKYFEKIPWGIITKDGNSYGYFKK